MTEELKEDFERPFLRVLRVLRDLYLKHKRRELTYGDVTKDSLDVTKPRGILRKTVVLHVLKSFECSFGQALMGVETGEVRVNPLAVQAADNLLRKASPEKRERLQKEVNIHALASTYKMKVGPHPPALGSVRILGARRELQKGIGRLFTIPHVHLPHRLSRGDRYDMTVEIETAVHLSFSISQKVPEGAIEWQDLGETAHVDRRCADPRPTKNANMVEKLIFGQVLTRPGRKDPEYAIRMIRDHKKSLSITFSLELADRPPSEGEYASYVLGMGHNRYGTGIMQGGKIMVGKRSQEFKSDTSLMYVSFSFEEGLSKGDTLPITIDVSCPMFWSTSANPDCDSTIEPAFELVRL